MKPWHLGVIFACVVLLAVGAVAGVVLYVMQEADERAAREIAQARTDQLAACERGNVLRARVQTINEVLGEFALSAASIRARSAKQATSREESNLNAEAAALYRALAERLEEVGQVECSLILNLNPGGQ